MRKILFTFALLLFNFSIYCQVTVTVEYKTKFVCNKKFGLDIKDGNFLMTVIYDDKNLKFNSYTGQKMSEFTIIKITEKYIIGKDENGNFSFFNINEKQFYYIDFYMNSYITAGHGASYSEIKQTVLYMSKMLDEGKSQKEVIQYLIEQSTYEY